MTTATMPERPARPVGFVGPFILIGLGVLFLLNNLGVLSWGVWATMLQLWPLALIAVGLEIMIGRRSAIGSFLVAVVTLVLLGMGIWWLGPRGWNGMPLQTQAVSQPLDGATNAEVDIHMGVGTLELGALTEGNDLVAGTIESQHLDRVVRTANVRGDTAYFSLRARNDGPNWNSQDHWTLQLNRQVPITLRIDTGVGTTRLNLAELAVRELRINAGVGQTFVTIPRAGSMTAWIEGGVGETVVTLPQEVAARLEIDKGLGNVTVPPGLVQHGNTYTSPGYEQATDRVALQINGGVGNIQIQHQP